MATKPQAAKSATPKPNEQKQLADMNLDEVRIFGYQVNKQITQLQGNLQQATRLMQGVYAREAELLKQKKEE